MEKKDGENSESIENDSGSRADNGASFWVGNFFCA